MKIIKSIVVPIDFSVTSRNAYHYAQHLAQLLSANINLVNVRANLIFATDMPVVSYAQMEEETQAVQLKQFIQDELNLVRNGVNPCTVKTIALLGDPETLLVKLSKTADSDLIVVGNTGLEDIISKLVGSVSLKLTNQAHCPVIIVPRNVKWSPITSILFASNDESLNYNLVKNISQFAKQISAQIHFVHVKNKDHEQEKEIDWSELIGLEQSNIKYETHTVYGQTVVQELKKYCRDKKINLIVFASEHRGFWENLMHKSESENMAFASDIPMMVIHLDDHN